jgi:hypothetical protein
MKKMASVESRKRFEFMDRSYELLEFESRCVTRLS